MKPTPTIIIDHLDVRIEPDLHNRLRWKEYQILSLLVQNSPNVVTREELVNHIWKGTYCSDSTINQTIKSVRQKIGDHEHKIIKTIPRIGYIIEEKQMVNISFDIIATAGTPVFDPPKQAIEAAVKQAQSTDEDIYSEPMWAFPTHSRLSRTVSKPTVFRLNAFKKIFFIYAEKFYQYKNRLIIVFLSTVILMIVLVYFYTIIKISVASYNLEWLNLNNRITSVQLTCPLGFKYEPDGS
ncbi:winged helix-turn-helix domain-containing protein [Sodalis sp. dw_96]|uniref:winged helix-turn-helix domain-containing protein n=1 Tax=Sodalis sp. dw_96 TaxID=2719794 RepID=UPI001BD420C3|nr:winged helix-turn-helix domain-containing protein [Sodalis sp. dw_96]